MCDLMCVSSVQVQENLTRVLVDQMIRYQADEALMGQRTRHQTTKALVGQRDGTSGNRKVQMN